MPSSVLNSDDGVISGTSGLKSTGGDDGVLKIQNNGTDAVTVAANGNVTLTDDLSVGGNASVTGNLTVTGTITGPSTANVQTFDTSGTWTKPASGSMARVQMWGGGGGGCRAATTTAGSGGGGGGYHELLVPLSYLDSSVSVTVAAGGAGRSGSTGNGTAGGTTSVPFANYEGSAKTFYAYGGGAGIVAGDAETGGGGLLSAGTGGTESGTRGSPGSPWIGARGDTGSAIDGGVLLEKIWGGGSSRLGSTNTLTLITVWGGNGGAGMSGSTNTTGGTPVYGGKGGDGARVTSGFDGTAPAGGGGSRNNNLNGGNGAAGRVIITVW